MKSSLLRFLKALPWFLLAIPLLAIAFVVLGLTDVFWLIAGRRRVRSGARPDTRAISIVVPNWNGRDLLEKFLPSWLASIAPHPGSEVVIVDNGSADGSAAWIAEIYPAEEYPELRVLALPENLGFGGGSNAGFRAAQNDVVVLLNSDMRVEPDFIAPLLAGFTDATVFAVSCQIFLADRTKRREETGLTEAYWRHGRLRVGHREDPEVGELFPCFYGGGGSCAFDRRKFLELGGFDEILRPFYLEDTDLGFLAWKRGWKVLYQPASVVHHEHRGTIGKRFSPGFIESVLRKNYLLFTWKNIHEWKRFAPHFLFALNGGRGVVSAFLRLPGAARSRWRARSLAAIGDSEAFRRPQPAYFHDRFSQFQSRPARPRVLFVSPYAIYPPTHGGGLFMYSTIRELSRSCEVHAIVMVDEARELSAQGELLRYCRTLELYVRRADRDPHLASITPHAIHEFHRPEIEWLIQRQILLHRIDVLQLEYTALGQYARRFDRVVCALFEHDIYFQSVGRALGFIHSPVDRLKAGFEYLRSLRFELNLLPRCDHIQVCTEENRRYLESFLPRLAPRIHAGLRAGIETALYPYPGGPRRPFTMLFLGGFRHKPNLIALQWFAREVLPIVTAAIPGARLVVAGSDPPPRHTFIDPANAVDLLGFVEDVQPLFSSCALFVCPIRSGSGVRVKLLEAFASGIPVVSTRIGAEGLARTDGELCALADEPAAFAERTIALLGDPARAEEMAARARTEVEANWDMAVITARLTANYLALLERKRSPAGSVMDRRTKATVIS